MLEVLVNRLDRCEHALMTETSIGDMYLYTPTPIPKINRICELDLICDSNQIENKPNALSFNIDNVADVMFNRINNFAQLSLDGKRADKKFDFIIKNVPIIIDPRTESFYFKIPKSKNNYVKDGILNLNSFPQKIKDIFSETNSQNHNSSWLEIKDNKLILLMVGYFATYQSRCKASIILPPAPLIDGRSSLTLKIANEINEKTKTFTIRRGAAYSAYYLPLHYKVFDNSKMIDYIYYSIKNAIDKQQRIIFLKILWYEYLNKNSIRRKRFSNLLTKIDLLKQQTNDGFLVFLLDAGSEGLPTLANGVDGYIEPMGGHIGVIRGKKISEDEANDLDKYTNKRHGSYLNPITREFIPFEDTLEIYKDNKNRLPCGCPSCVKYEGKLSYETPTLQWNLDRRIHTVNVRRRETNKLFNSIQGKNIRDVSFKLLECGDKNLLDLLPNYI